MAQARRKRTRARRRFRIAFDIPWSAVYRWTLVLTLLLGTLVGGSWGISRLADPNTLPLRVVRIDGDFRYLDRKALEKAVTGRVRGGFFTVDVNAVRREALKLAWVDRVRVRRVWPDTLSIFITEQVPLARWGKRRLVNPEGRIFEPESGVLPPGLPVLWGPDEAAPLVTSGYLALQQVCEGRELRIVALRRSARGSWRLSFSDGLVVKLGKKDVERRLARFVRLYPSLLARGAGPLKLIDLRYANGFAARWANAQGTRDAQRARPTSEGARGGRDPDGGRAV